MAPKTPTEKAFNRFMVDKMAALRLLSRHIGFIGPVSISWEERRALFNRMNGWRLVSLSLEAMLDDDAEWYRKEAASILMDILIPEWRDVVGIEIVGHVLKRRDNRVRLWRKAVLERDNHTCQKCGDTSRLEAHHIIHWADAPALRIHPDNGVTLCKPCHLKEHSGVPTVGWHSEELKNFKGNQNAYC